MVSETHNCDCMDYMTSLPEKFFDLAICDPPYGININPNMGRKRGKRKNHDDSKKWDNEIPNFEYFEELFRITKNQIIWGGNYFPLDLTNSWIFWDKGVPDGVSFSDGELAWTSFDCVLRKAKIPYSGFIGTEGKIHPTQKPVALYKWLLKNYAKPGDKIFDSHLGSGSSRIAAYDMGFDFYATELDSDYFSAAEQRFAKHVAQQSLFTAKEQFTAKQGVLL